MLGAPTQRQRQVRCQRCRADLVKLPHDCSDCMTFDHRLLRVYEMISGADCSGNDVRFAAHSDLRRNRAMSELCQQQTYRLQHNSNVVTLQAPNRLALARKKHTYSKDVNPGRSSQHCPLRARFALPSLQFVHILVQ
jgi:hypothetical protein